MRCLSKLENITPDKYEILYYQNILFQLGQVYEESEENKNGDIPYTIKYAGGVTFYKNKKKFFGIGIRRNQKGELVSLEASKLTSSPFWFLLIPIPKNFFLFL